MSNVSKNQGEEESLTCAGAIPCALPGKHTEGVSVGNVPEQTRWYVLRVHYGRIAKVREMLDADSVEYYVPLHRTYKIIDGKKKLVKEPLLPNLIFVYTTSTLADAIVKNYVRKNKISGKRKTKTERDEVLDDTSNDKPAVTNYVSYYYDHFTVNREGHNPPLTIPDYQMQNFIALTSIDNEHIMLVDQEHCHFKSGDIVRVTEGQFKDITGRVARVAGQQRVVIELSNLCLIASAYIPSAFLEIVDQKAD